MISQKKMWLIYNELGMQLRNKAPKRRVKAKLRDDRTAAVGPNDIWAMPCHDRRCGASLRVDFVHDQLATGRKLRVLTVVDTYSRWSRYWTRGSAIGVKTWLRRWTGCAAKSAIPGQSASTRAVSSSPATWTSGHTGTMSFWTSHSRGNRRKTHPSKRSMDASEQNA